MCRVRTKSPLHDPKLLNFKLCSMRRIDHKRGTIMLLYVVLGLLQFIIQPATLNTTGTVSFVAVLFIASLNFFTMHLLPLKLPSVY